uniref:Polyprotein protein n=1 Tax=Solanum tuberosum TaxID=4113 RepID=M1DND7_SOLTU
MGLQEIITAQGLALDALIARVEAYIPEDPVFEMLIVLASSQIPPTNVTEDVAVVDEDGESDMPEMDEEELGTHEKAYYEDLEDLEGDFLWVATEASLHSMPIVGSRGCKPTKEIVAPPSIAGDKQGTDAQVEACNTLDLKE